MSKRWYASESQIRWVVRQLLAGRTLNHQIAIEEAGCHRLAAVVGNLVHKYGWPIPREYRGSENVAHYWLSPDADRRRLRFPNSAKDLGDDEAA